MRPAELCEQVLAEAAQIAWARRTLDAATGPAVAGAPEAPLDRTTLARAAANSGGQRRRARALARGGL